MKGLLEVWSYDTFLECQDTWPYLEDESREAQKCKSKIKNLLSDILERFKAEGLVCIRPRPIEKLKRLDIRKIDDLIKQSVKEYKK